MKSSPSALVLVNLASLFISTSGILGRLIELPSMVTSFFRCVIGLLFLAILSWAIRRKTGYKNLGQMKDFVWSGFFLAAHWGTYFYALQVSNVSIAIISLFTYPIITTLIEPVFFRTQLEGINLLTSAIVVVGVIVLVPEFNMDNNLTYGLVVGLFSALLYALRNLFSKQLVGVYDGEVTMMYQLIIAAVFLSPTLFIYSFEIDGRNFQLLLVLGFLTTALGHTFFLLALRRLSTSTASILASLQPVYAIILAVLIIDESINWKILVGGGLILFAVVLQNISLQSTKNE